MFSGIVENVETVVETLLLLERKQLLHRDMISNVICDTECPC